MTLSQPSHIRSADRATLIAEFHEFAEHRGSQGKTERAEAARYAAEMLANGAGAVFFERQWHIVGEPDRYTVYAGTREAVTKTIDELGVVAMHHKEMERAREAAQALYALKDGESPVRVGNLVYEVIDENYFAGGYAEVLEQIAQHGVARARTRMKPEERELTVAQAAIEAGANRAHADGVTYVVV